MYLKVNFKLMLSTIVTITVKLMGFSTLFPARVTSPVNFGFEALVISPTLIRT